jgi:hypothetical protein
MEYKCKGHVIGNYWGGGKGSYPITKLKAVTKEELLKIANEKLKDGSLDSGMGYESLIGARLDIEEIDTVIVNDKSYSRSEYYTEFIGELTDDELEFLENLD